MNRIKLTHITGPDFSSAYSEMKMYRISLGNGQKEFFSNEKKARKCLAGINRFLNQKLHELNQLMIMVYGEYRNKWFYLEPDKIEYINVKIASSEKALIKLITPRSGVNFNYYIYTDFKMIIDNCLAILKTLKITSINDGVWSEVHRIDFCTSWLERIYNDLFQINNYDTEKVSAKEPELCNH